MNTTSETQSIRQQPPMTQFNCKWSCNTVLTTKNSLWSHQSQCKLKNKNIGTNAKQETPSLTTAQLINSNADTNPNECKEHAQLVQGPVVARRSDDYIIVIDCEASCQTETTMADLDDLLLLKSQWQLQLVEDALMIPKMIVNTNVVQKTMPQCTQPLKSRQIGTLLKRKHLERTFRIQKIKRTFKLQKIKHTGQVKAIFSLKGRQSKKEVEKAARDSLSHRMALDKRGLDKETFQQKYQARIDLAKEFHSNRFLNATQRTKDMLKQVNHSYVQYKKHAFTTETDKPPSDFVELDYEKLDLVDDGINYDGIDKHSIDCSNDVAELYSLKECGHIHSTLLCLKIYRDLLTRAKDTQTAFQTLTSGFALNKHQLQIKSLFIDLNSRLLYNADQQAKTDRYKYLQALLSLRLENQQYHKKVVVSFQPLFAKNMEWQAFTKKDLQITLGEMFAGTEDEIQRRTDHLKEKLYDNLKHYTNLLNQNIEVTQLLVEVLSQMNEIQLEAFLEHLNQCDRIKHIPSTEKALKAIVEQAAWQYTYDILKCTHTHALQSTKTQLCPEIGDIQAQYSYEFRCKSCDFCFEVHPLFIPEVLQGLVKHKRSKKIERQLLDFKQKSSVNYEYQRMLEEGEQHIYVEEQDEQQLLFLQTLQQQAVHKHKIVPKTELVQPSKVELRQVYISPAEMDIDGILDAQTRQIDAPYQKLTMTAGQVKLDDFDEIWHQRIKTCVIKYLTGLRTKKIDWVQYA